MRFYAGQQFERDGIEYRVLPGNRCDGDLVIEFKVNGWHRPKIAHTMILTAFKFQVEENNYGQSGKVKSGRGGWYLLEKIKRACLYGWQQEVDAIAQQRHVLEATKEAARAQLSLPV